MNPPRRVVVGLGNPDRGDDGAGRAVVRALRGRLPADVALIEASGEATALIAAIEGADLAVLVDASLSGAPPGTIRRFDARAEPLAELGRSPGSTHGLGLAAAVALGEALGALPRRVVILAVEGAAFATGAGLSPEVARAVEAAAGAVAAEVAEAWAGSDDPLPSRSG